MLHHPNKIAKRLIWNSPLPQCPDAVVTQLGECHAEDVDVAGSSPANRIFIFPIY